MRFAQSTTLIEGSKFKIFLVYAQAGGNMVADELEPCKLVAVEYDTGIRLLDEPLVEALVNRFSKGFENRKLFQRKSDKRDKVCETSSVRAASHFVRRGGGEGIPQIVFGPRGMLFSKLLL